MLGGQYSKYVHIIIISFSRMGRFVVRQSPAPPTPMLFESFGPHSGNLTYIPRQTIAQFPRASTTMEAVINADF